MIGFVIWDRRTPVGPAPDMRMIQIGIVLGAVGVVATLMFWWLILPVVLLLVGGALIVVGRHRIAVAG